MGALPKVDRAALAEFIDANWSRPHKSKITGEMVIGLYETYKIPILATIVILGAETSFGDPEQGGELARLNNFGCIKGDVRGPWSETSNGLVLIRGVYWHTWPTPEAGLNAWGMYLNMRFDGLYLKWIRDGEWLAFANAYYGLSVPGFSEYVNGILGRVKNVRAKALTAGYQW